jgi:Tol biopolymer transport system component
MRTPLGIAVLLVLLCANDAFAAYPGRNGKLLFVRDNPAADDEQVGISGTELWTANVDGLGARRLTNAVTGLIVGIHAQWSPDGTRIAFSSNCGFKYRTTCGQIYVTDASGRETRTITHAAENIPSGLDMSPTWSPDGTKLAFTRIEPVSGVYTVGVDGGSETKIFDLSYDNLAWSPDGTRFAFWEGHDNGRSTVDVANVDGTGLRVVAATRLIDADPDWSPDGTTIAFAKATGRFSRVCLVAAAGGSVRCLVRGTEPAWSPDGRSIAFRRYYDIYVMRSDGTHVRNVTRTPHLVELAPDWQPLP